MRRSERLGLAFLKRYGGGGEGGGDRVQEMSETKEVFIVTLG